MFLYIHCLARLSGPCGGILRRQLPGHTYITMPRRGGQLPGGGWFSKTTASWAPDTMPRGGGAAFWRVMVFEDDNFMGTMSPYSKLNLTDPCRTVSYQYHFWGMLGREPKTGQLKLARQGIEQILSLKQRWRPLPFLLNLSCFYEKETAFCWIKLCPNFIRISLPLHVFFPNFANQVNSQLRRRAP